MNRFGHLFVVATLVSSFSLKAHTQNNAPAAPVDKNPQTGIYTIKATAREVVLDIVVTNPDGSPVPNLTQDDFSVYENKVPQKILNFERTTPETAGPGGRPPIPIQSTAELDRLEPNAPVGIVVLDEITTQFFDKAFALYSLKKYLDTQGTIMQPTMLMAVSIGHRQVLRDYTTSKSELLQALQKHLASDNTRYSGQEWLQEQFDAATDALISVAQATAGHPGHKNLIWIGRGFPTLDISQLDPQDLAQVEANIATLANTLRDSRVTLSSIDPQGVEGSILEQDADGFLTTDPFGSSIGFDALAQSTGGQVFHGTNDLKNLIESSMRDGQTFYTVTYRPSSQSDEVSPFRNITVRMKDPHLQAATRQGYYDRIPPLAPTFDAKGTPSPKTMYDLITAGKGLLIYDGIPLTVELDPSAPDHFFLKLRASSFEWEPNADGKTQFAKVTVLYNSYDRKGKVLFAKAYSEKLVSPILDQAQLATKEIRSGAVVPSAPPAARLRIVIRSDASGKIGADNVYLVDRKTLIDPETGVKGQPPRK